MSRVLMVSAPVLGLLIAYVDSRPTWDDTGVTALVLFICSGIWGALEPSRPWLWAVLIGAWIPVYGIATTGNYGSLLALCIAFVGAYAGMASRRTLVRA